MHEGAYDNPFSDASEIHSRMNLPVTLGRGISSHSTIILTPGIGRSTLRSLVAISFILYLPDATSMTSPG